MKGQELRWIVRTVRMIKGPAEIVEVGSFKGRSLIATGLSMTNGGRLFSIDSNQTKTPGTWVQDHLAIALKLIMDLNSEVFAQHFKMKSKKAVELFKDNSLDYVFIDGDHSYEEVCHDIDAWRMKVKKGGILAGHDYGEPGTEANKKHPGVYHAVKHKIKGVTNEVGTIWSWIKL